MIETIYFTVALIVAAVTLVVGVVIVAAKANDAEDTAVELFIAFLAAAAAGIVWPAATIFGIAYGAVMGIRYGLERRKMREFACRHAPEPETDAGKYRRMGP
jgi:hypothetical protein